MAPVKSKGSLREKYLDMLEAAKALLPGLKVYRGGSLINMLESIKNSLFGKPHLPHSQMIEHGIHAVTFEAVARKGKMPRADNEQLSGLLSLLEVLTRIFDQLDEQLHAGSYFYITIGTSKFVSNSFFIYPAGMIFAGLLVPTLIDFVRNGKNDIKTGLFLVALYTAAFTLVKLPEMLPNKKADFYAICLVLFWM